MKTATLPKPIKSKNPVVILRAVIKAIKEEPKRYDQMAYINRRGARAKDSYFPECGTVACVAGWTKLLTDSKRPASEVLGLDLVEATELFSPYVDSIRVRSSVTPRQHASDGIKHIKRFVLKKWGKKL